MKDYFNAFELQALKKQAIAISDEPLQDTMKLGERRCILNGKGQAISATGEHHNFIDEDFLTFAVAAHATIPGLVDEILRLRKQVRFFEAASEMGCENPPAGCECPGCSYAQEMWGGIPPR